MATPAPFVKFYLVQYREVTPKFHAIESLKGEVVELFTPRWHESEMRKGDILWFGLGSYHDKKRQAKILAIEDNMEDIKYEHQRIVFARKDPREDFLFGEELHKAEIEDLMAVHQATDPQILRLGDLIVNNHKNMLRQINSNILFDRNAAKLLTCNKIHVFCPSERKPGRLCPGCDKCSKHKCVRQNFENILTEAEKNDSIFGNWENELPICADTVYLGTYCTEMDINVMRKVNWKDPAQAAKLMISNAFYKLSPAFQRDTKIGDVASTVSRFCKIPIGAATEFVEKGYEETWPLQAKVYLDKRKPVDQKIVDKELPLYNF